MKYTPYVTDKVKGQVRLAGQKAWGEPEMMQGLNQVKSDVQAHMLQEAPRRFRKLVEEDVCRPVDPVVEPIHDSSVEETVNHPQPVITVL